MNRTLLKRMVAWLCVLAFGLNATVLAHGVVQCRAIDGSTRLEWGCPKDIGGRCANALPAVVSDDGTPSNLSESVPCDDAPVMTHPIVIDQSSIQKSLKHLDLLPAPLLMAFPIEVVPPVKIVWVRPTSILGSPPELRSLRTIVILV